MAQGSPSGRYFSLQLSRTVPSSTRPRTCEAGAVEALTYY